MKKSNESTLTIEDYGREIKNSRKSFYRLRDGEYRIRLSDIWPKDKLGCSDDLCKYLINTLRKGIKCLRTNSKEEAEVFYGFVEEIKKNLIGVNDQKEIIEYVKRLKKQKLEVLNFIFKSPISLLNYFEKSFTLLLDDMAVEKYGFSKEELYDYQNGTGKKFLYRDDVKVVDNHNLIYFFPRTAYSVPIKLPKELLFSNQRNDLGFVVSFNFKDNVHKVVELNVDENSYKEYYYNVLKNLTQKEKKVIKKRPRAFRFKNTGNPGVRVGPDYLKSLTITENDLLEKFGYSGQFGNWVAQRDRMRFLRELYLASCDLAVAIGCSPKDLSLLKDGFPLGIAFAARGSGKAQGHFESTDYVINLTKIATLEGNCGILAHEFGHALDNWLGFKYLNKDLMFSEIFINNLNEFPEFKQLIKYLMNTSTRFDSDSVAIDLLESRKKPYWSSIKEKFARAFSSFIIESLKQKGRQNDFLAFNFNDEIEVRDRLISANPKGEDLVEITNLFERVFERLFNDGILTRLNEEDLYLNKKDSPDGQGQFTFI